MLRWLLGIAAVLFSALAAVIYGRLPIAPTEGCSGYTRATGPLVAHAGGGLPDRFYANNLAAIDLSAKHGHTMIEMDFIERGGRLLIGHDEGKISSLTLPALVTWLDRHPEVLIVTDIKTNNLSGLRIIKGTGRQAHFIPQIYKPDQLKPATALGYQKVIFAERYQESQNWFPWVNSVDLWAVTIPKEKVGLAPKIKHPVFLYTVNHPVPGVGLYTDCLIPS